MLENRVRMPAYRAALSAAITPGAVVLDLGAGTGVMAMLACRYGARHVYAIEFSEAIQVARETAAANGLEDRITFIQGDSKKVNLPEKVDLIVEDMRGAMPWFGSHIPDVVDARRRFLRPGGQIISRRDTAYCAVVEAGSLYDELTRPWRDGVEGLDLSAAIRYATNSRHALSKGRGKLLTEGAPWATIDYQTVESASASGSASLNVTDAGTGHGLALWFDGELVPGITISDAPGKPETVYSPLFLPWPEPVGLDATSRVSVKLRADHIGGDYIYSWETRIHNCGAPPAQELRFRQSDFLGTPLTHESLARHASGHKPVASAEGVAAKYVLDRMNGSAPLTEIATGLAAEFPGQFSSLRAALDFAASLSLQYGD